MFSGFCSKHRVARAICGCLVGALVTPSISAMWHGDPGAKVPRVQGVMSIGALPTGPSSSVSAGVMLISDTTISNRNYVMVWPDQRKKGHLGPTGPRADDRLNMPRVYTGPFGHPTGPTGGGPPSSPPSSGV
jgi:hypothetical protein